MRRPTAAAPLLALALLCQATVAAADTFRVRDRLAPTEISEVTTLYIDGKLIRSFRLDAETRDVTVTVTVPDAPEHMFGLCGQVRVRDADGTERKQVVDVTGILTDTDGRDYEAVATNDFTRFYIVETTEGRPPAPITPLREPACSPAVS